jgi:hypothetical protein
MAMGKRRRHAKQASMWVATQDLPRSAAHPFYARLNQILGVRASRLLNTAALHRIDHLLDADG